MLPVLTILLVLVLSMAIIRVGTVALVLTGLSDQLARFQSRSAFLGVGFTTRESEDVVNHPVRRRIITTLMLFGQVGVITTAASLIGSIVSVDASAGWMGPVLFRMTALALGATLLLWLSYSSHVDKWLSAAISWSLRRWTDLEVKDYSWLLRMSRSYAVSEQLVESGDWLAGRSLAELDLPKEGVLVLGVERAGTGTYLGAPKGTTVVAPGDTLILYGHQDTLAELDQREAGIEGNIHHVIAVTAALDAKAEEERADVRAAGTEVA